MYLPLRSYKACLFLPASFTEEMNRVPLHKGAHLKRKKKSSQEEDTLPLLLDDKRLTNQEQNTEKRMYQIACGYHNALAFPLIHLIKKGVCIV